MPAAAFLGELTARVRRLCRGTGRVIVGIAGPPGAGKSTLARALVDAVNREPSPSGDLQPWGALVPLDGFHLADVQLERLALWDRKGAPETFDARGFVALLRRLRAETATTVYAPGFERALEQPIAAAVAVPPSVQLVVTEGNYLLLPGEPWGAVKPLLDEVWYLDHDATERVRALIARHVEYGKAPDEAREWVTRSDEANARLVATSAERADLVLGLGWGRQDTSSSALA